ncbi:hypothetical protein [Williamsia serinedens]|uniref:Uncharacterized protein n=1 Tax=Williamsia serinedens TaxID=391736 RepID=A0ABT1H644_9NOCA|nr:hypothetical protein [Williamsia serinedens]MCP2162641.1 hypothetical protein [Williamsia serinedens]
MEIDQRGQLGPLLSDMSVPDFRLPTSVMAAVYALSAGKYDSCYLDVEVDNSGITYKFWWLQGDVIGWVTASSSDIDWQHRPLREEPEDAKTDAQLRRIGDIERIELAELKVWQDGFQTGVLSVDAPIRLAFRQGDGLALGDRDPRNAAGREKRDAFVKAVMKAFGATRP